MYYRVEKATIKEIKETVMIKNKATSAMNQQPPDHN